MQALIIGTSEVRQIDGLYSLNDLHRASGNENRHRPSLFIENKQSQDLIAEITKAGITALRTKKGGTQGGTYACKELVIAYAAWISPAFHLKVIRVFLAEAGRTLPEKQDINLLDKDYFAKVRDIAIKFADDWVRVGKGEDVHPSLTIPDDVLAGIIAQQISRQNFRLYVDYAGQLHVAPIPNKSPYEGLAEAIADPGNIGLTDEVIEEIGAACVKALAYRAQQRKSIISRTRGAK